MRRLRGQSPGLDPWPTRASIVCSELRVSTTYRRKRRRRCGYPPPRDCVLTFARNELRQRTAVRREAVHMKVDRHRRTVAIAGRLREYRSIAIVPNDEGQPDGHPGPQS